jgi:hypothetical protein
MKRHLCILIDTVALINSILLFNNALIRHLFNYMDADLKH